MRYVDYMAFSFGFVKDQFPTLLCLVSVDACFCHFSLGAYQLFSMIGISSNFNMIPMGYVIIVGNESGDTWTRTAVFCRRQHPTLGRLTTVISDGNKCIPIGIENAFPADDKPREVACAHHRGGNLSIRGKACTKQFHKMLDVETVEKLLKSRIHQSSKPLDQPL